MVLQAWRENLASFPSLTLILAPRHPERFKEVQEMLSSKGVPFVGRSSISEGELAGKLDHGVVLLDSIGELSAVYGVADIAIMGKSFKGEGGQNPLEPAYWGKAIICGPHMENFPFMREFYDEGAAFEVAEASLTEKMRELLASPEKAREAGEKARALYRQNSGAVARAMVVIKEVLRDGS